MWSCFKASQCPPPPFVSCFVSICLSYVFDVHICLIYGRSDLSCCFFWYSLYTKRFTWEKGLFCVIFKKCRAAKWYDAKFRTQMCATDCGNPRQSTGLTWPRQPECGACQSAVHLGAVCQEVIPVVAIRGIWLRNLANDRIPAPTILHQQFPCLLCHKCLMRDFLGVRQIRGGLFRPKQYTNGLSWQTISWYYPFNVRITWRSNLC
jgi:hypothetical protein